MLLLPEHAEKKIIVIAQQLKGWAYESHCWDCTMGNISGPKECMWCGATSVVEMEIDKGEQICPGNPFITQAIIEKIRKMQDGEE